MELHRQQCTPCRGGIDPLDDTAVAALISACPDWTVQSGPSRLFRHFEFPDFAQALAFVNAVGAVAEANGHHPDVCFGWGYTTVTLYTHKIRGLHENDFIIAAKLDRLFAEGAGHVSDGR